MASSIFDSNIPKAFIYPGNACWIGWSRRRLVPVEGTLETNIEHVPDNVHEFNITCEDCNLNYANVAKLIQKETTTSVKLYLSQSVAKSNPCAISVADAISKSTIKKFYINDNMCRSYVSSSSRICEYPESIVPSITFPGTLDSIDLYVPSIRNEDIWKLLSGIPLSVTSIKIYAWSTSVLSEDVVKRIVSLDALKHLHIIAVSDTCRCFTYRQMLEKHSRIETFEIQCCPWHLRMLVDAALNSLYLRQLSLNPRPGARYTDDVFEQSLKETRLAIKQFRCHPTVTTLQLGQYEDDIRNMLAMKNSHNVKNLCVLIHSQVSPRSFRRGELLPVDSLRLLRGYLYE
jgi:hypothetical protein